MATLKNTKKFAQTFNLVAPAEHREAGDFAYQEVTTQVTEDMGDGKFGVRVVERKLPSSLTLLGGETREGLPEWVKACPEVKAALSRGTLRLVSE